MLKSLLRKTASALMRLWKASKLCVAGLIIILFFVAMAMLAPFITPYDPYKKFVGPRYNPPSSKFWLGTDDVGRDVLSMIIFGSRVSLMIGVCAATCACLLGTLIGLISGYLGGVVDVILMRTTDVFLTLPFMSIAIILAFVFGPQAWMIIFIFTVFAWPGMARQIRSQVMSIKATLFIEATQSIGAGHLRIMFCHILPHLTGIIAASLTQSSVGAIMMEAGLAFIGLSDIRNISWGMLLNSAMRAYAFSYGAWWVIVAPGACIALLSVGFAFLGHGINKLLRPITA